MEFEAKIKKLQDRFTFEVRVARHAHAHAHAHALNHSAAQTLSLCSAMASYVSQQIPPLLSW